MTPVEPTALLHLREVHIIVEQYFMKDGANDKEFHDIIKLITTRLIVRWTNTTVLI